MNRFARTATWLGSLGLLLGAGFALSAAHAATPTSAKFNTQGEPDPAADQIQKKEATLRSMSDADRPAATRDLAFAIRKLKYGSQKLDLALELAFLSTEGDFGADTLKEVAKTLVIARGPATGTTADDANRELADLADYEGVPIHDSTPGYLKALAFVKKIDRVRAKADFTLKDLNGKPWTLSKLKGKVVVVNFWATWCPPCRKEMPDLERFSQLYGPKGFVVLAISDEPLSTVEPFIASHGITYTVLLDPGRKVNTLYSVDGIPKSFVYNRKGRLVATAMDMRTKGQFEKMLAKAGLP